MRWFADWRPNPAHRARRGAVLSTGLVQAPDFHRRRCLAVTVLTCRVTRGWLITARGRLCALPPSCSMQLDHEHRL